MHPMRTFGGNGWGGGGEGEGGGGGGEGLEWTLREKVSVAPEAKLKYWSRSVCVWCVTERVPVPDNSISCNLQRRISMHQTPGEQLTCVCICIYVRGPSPNPSAPSERTSRD